MIENLPNWKEALKWWKGWGPIMFSLVPFLEKLHPWENKDEESGLMIFVQYITVLYAASLEVAGERVILMMPSIPGSDGHYYFFRDWWKVLFSTRKG